MKRPLSLYAVLLLALILRAPAWFTEDVKTRFQLIEPDDFQHAEIALSLMKSWGAEGYANWEPEQPTYNTRGFALQMGVIAYIGDIITGWKPGVPEMVMLERILATFYAL